MDTILDDYADAERQVRLDWRVVNDNVMGGRSRGRFDLRDGHLVFAGSTNTNGGGFSSIRAGGLNLDLSASGGIRLKLSADGRQYTWRLTTDATWRGRQVAYWASFKTSNGPDQIIDIPFSDFVPRFRGMTLPGPVLNPARITGMGLMIYDGLDGPFELRLQQVGSFQADSPVTLKSLRWQKRVLVLSAPSVSDNQMAAQMEAIRGYEADMAERDLMAVILTPDRAYAWPETVQAAWRQELGLPSDGFALRLIGKDGSVKRRADAAVPMTEIFAQIDGMPMRRREMRERQTH